MLGLTAVAVSVGATACGGGDTGSESQQTSSPAASWAPAQNPQAARTSLVTVASDKDFQSTVDGVKQAVSANGMMILGDLDQAGALKTTGLELKGARFSSSSTTYATNWRTRECSWPVSAAPPTTRHGT
nr:SCE36.05c, unknown, len: 407aa; contains a repeat region [Kibdelosporangium sp. MJ126-NF4]